MNPNSTQTASKNLYTSKDGKIRVDVENGNPSQRAGQVHLQIGEDKYIFNNIDKKFYCDGTSNLAPSKIQEYLSDPNIKKAVDKGLTKYLNFWGLNG